MEFVCYSDWKQLPDSVNKLFATAEKESLFFSRPWFQNLVENGLDEGQSYLLACVLDQERVVALLPLTQRDIGHYRSLKHLYTSLYTLLLAETAQQEILACLVQGLKRLPIYHLQLDPIAADESNLQRLQSVMESSGFSSHRYFSFHNWIYRLQGESFTDYMATRPARVRNTIARKKRKLEREHGYHIRLYTDRNLQQAMADYNAVYAASWKANELHEDFINGLATNLSQAGWLRLAILYVEYQPVAAQFWIVANGKASIFKLNYDKAWKQYSPGSILMAFLMQQVIDNDKVDEIDFLTGNDAYKQDWMSERRERWRLNCINKTNPKRKRHRLTDRLDGLLKSFKKESV